jgi:hypothetical protein
MKMDLQNVPSGKIGKGFLSLLVAVWAGSSPLVHAKASKDGSPSAKSTQVLLTDDIGNQGRAVLSVRDLKELISMRDRGPSSRSAKESQGPQSLLGANLFLFKMSKTETHKLWKKIVAIETEREALVAKLSSDLSSRKEKLRTDRRKIQASRLTAREQSDQMLGKKLYESILEESNLDAQRDQALARFDEQNSVSLDFVEHNGQRTVEAIHVGDSRIWSPDSGIEVARKN